MKTDKTHEDWYLACETYQTLAIQYIYTKRSSFLNSSHCVTCFTKKKSEEQYFGWCLVNFYNGPLEASAGM